MAPARCILFMLVNGGLCSLSSPRAEETTVPYDPLNLPASGEVNVLPLTVTDAKRDRDIPIRVYLPAVKSPAPVILFSHGLGGSRNGSAFLGKHWAGRGYAAVFLQHPGSDEEVWKNKRPAKRMLAMRRAANAKNFMLRVKDVPAVLDQLNAWNTETKHPLTARLDLTRVGMSGHSFGALTTQAVSGQRMGRGDSSFTDARITAAIAMSPSSPHRGKPEDAFGHVSIPWLLMTGTQDLASIGKADMKSRLAVFPALPPGEKYELVLYKAEHSAFTERALPGDKEPRNPNHHRAILAISTAFWDACLRDHAPARTWLDGDGVQSVLEKKDRWQKK